MSAINCDIYMSAFSSEIVFAVSTTENNQYEGVAPKHYAQFQGEPSNETPVKGVLQVKVIEKNDGEAKVYMPDGEIISVKQNILCH
jgi:hypothetical protein